MEQDSMIINGYLFKEPKNFTKCSIEMRFDENEEDTIKIYKENGYKFLYSIGGSDDYPIGIEIFKRFKENDWESTPLYLVEIWEHGIFHHDDTLFADSLFDFNYLLKEIEPMINIAKYFEQKEE